MSDEHVVLRGLRAFEGPMTPRMEALHSVFAAQWSRFVDRLRDRSIVSGAFWSSDDPELLAALLPRLEWLAGEVRQAWETMRDAVDLGEASRLEALFARAEGLTPRSTLRAIDSARMADRFTDADRAAIRRRRGRCG